MCFEYEIKISKHGVKNILFLWEWLSKNTVSRRFNANMQLLSKYDWKLWKDGEGVDFKRMSELVLYIFVTLKMWTVPLMFMKSSTNLKLQTC